MSRRPERGQFRSITVVLLDGPDFQQLPPEARWVFVCLKCSLGPCGIQVEYPLGLIEKLAGRTGYPQAVVAQMLDRLQADGWVRSERNVIWAVGQLQNEPSLSPKNDNHKPTVLAHVQGLPRLGIVGDFIRACRDYFTNPDELVKAYPKAGEPVVFAHAIPHPMGHPMGDHRKGQGVPRSETDEDTVSNETGTAGERRDPDLRSCMGLVIDKLYFGNRPPEAALRNEASIAKALGTHYGYDRLALAIQGLAIRREAGELHGVGPRGTVGLKWLNSKRFDVNQFVASEDAYYRSNAPARTKAGMADLGTVAASIVGRIGA